MDFCVTCPVRGDAVVADESLDFEVTLLVSGDAANVISDEFNCLPVVLLEVGT